MEILDSVFYIKIKVLFELMELFKLLLPVAITVIIQLIILPVYFRISGFHNNYSEFVLHRFCPT